MDPQNLLERFLGLEGAQNVRSSAQAAKDKAANSGLAGIAGGVAAGGVLGLLIGNKKMRKKVGKLAGGVVGYGGAAALGALAYRAYQNYQSQNATVPQTVRSDTPPSTAVPTSEQSSSGFLPAPVPAKDGRPFELAMVLAMIAAANADGHIGPDEQKAIFDRVAELPLDAEEKGFVFDALSNPPGLADIAGLAEGPEQSAELYLASRLAIDPDHPMEQAYLEALAHRLSLPDELVNHLEREVAAAIA